jgi:hypothetical protein
MGTADRQVAGVPITEEEGTTDQGSVRTMVRLGRPRPQPHSSPPPSPPILTARPPVNARPPGEKPAGPHAPPPPKTGGAL